jgi:poly-gamma-glutamate synthesis protein (capsule biosynthesis protein)
MIESARSSERSAKPLGPPGQTVTLFLAGDVMLGRGIDQVLPHPSDPRIHERGTPSAQDYVALAERVHGPIPRPVDHAYVWGDGLAELDRVAPDVRLVNLETAITTSESYEPKGINYRMHPKNVPCLTAAHIDCCVLSNNHALDWGDAGLLETIEVLQRAGIQPAGAGRNDAEAACAALIQARGGARVVVFGLAGATSGIPPRWNASTHKPGVNLVEDLSPGTARRIAQQVGRVKRAGDIAVASIHWGPNWGYEISLEEQRFARLLIDEAGIDVVHGHSSHHPKGIEVHSGRVILYGCGDLLNDYEGIAGYEEYRDDLGLMYFVDVEPASGKLKGVRMAPFQIRKFRLNRAAPSDTAWLHQRLDEASRPLGTGIERTPDGHLAIAWSE